MHPESVIAGVYSNTPLQLVAKGVNMMLTLSEMQKNSVRVSVVCSVERCAYVRAT